MLEHRVNLERIDVGLQAIVYSRENLNSYKEITIDIITRKLHDLSISFFPNNQYFYYSLVVPYQMVPRNSTQQLQGWSLSFVCSL